MRSQALGKYLVKMAAGEEQAGIANASSVSYSTTVDPRKIPHPRSSQSGKITNPTWYGPLDERKEIIMLKGAITASLILRLLDLVINAIRTGPLWKILPRGSFPVDIFSQLLELIRIASPKQHKAALELHRGMEKLLTAWKDDRVFDASQCMRLREPARSSYNHWLVWLRGKHPHEYQKLQQDCKLPRALADLPRIHGSHTDAWHQLPAGAILPHIRGRQPIDVTQLRPVALCDPMALDPELLKVVQKHIENANRIYAVPKRSLYDDDEIDEIELNGLGLRVFKDLKTGKRTAAKTYYGHSVQYVQELKKRRKTGAPPEMYWSAPTQVQPPVTQAAPPPPQFKPPPGYVPPPPPTAWGAPGPPPPPPPSTGRGWVPPPPPPQQYGRQDGYRSQYPAAPPPPPFQSMGRGSAQWNDRDRDRDRDRYNGNHNGGRGGYGRGGGGGGRPGNDRGGWNNSGGRGGAARWNR